MAITRLPLPQKYKVVPAVVPTAGAVAAMTATVVDGTGFERVMFIDSTGAAATGATRTFKIQSSATSGGSYTDVSNAALTNQTAAANASKIHILDMPINDAKPFMKVVGSVGTDTFANGVVAVLYNGTSFPVDTSYATELVQI